MTKSELDSKLLTNVIDLRFVRRRPVAGLPATRRILCTKSADLLNSVEGKIHLNYRAPGSQPNFDPTTKNLITVWDIFMQDYRNINGDAFDVINQIPADETFWKYTIEKDLRPFLLHNVAFKLNNKIIKRGKLQLVNIKQFFIKFNLQTSDGIKTFEVPYPYNYSICNNQCTFEYTLSSLCQSNKSQLYYKLKTINHKGSNKMYDNFLHMLCLTGSDI
ncbi:hypothetical protein EBU95_20730 [bacterium]|nr:hypothetical protein [bacterium]